MPGFHSPETMLMEQAQISTQLPFHQQSTNNPHKHKNHPRRWPAPQADTTAPYRAGVHWRLLQHYQ
jgi:hypothetical protein